MLGGRAQTVPATVTNNHTLKVLPSPLNTKDVLNLYFSGWTRMGSQYCSHLFPELPIAE